MLVFELLEYLYKPVLSTATSPRRFLWAERAGSWRREWVLEWVGGLGHCNQARRKRRFVLLRVSWEGRTWKVPWCSHLVPIPDAPAGEATRWGPITCPGYNSHHCWMRKWLGMMQVTKSRRVPRAQAWGSLVLKLRSALDRQLRSLNLPSSSKKSPKGPTLSVLPSSFLQRYK